MINMENRDIKTVNIILNLIAEKKITEQQFLFEMGFNRTLLSDWKSGKSKSYMKHLPKIADYFGVSTDYLLGNTEVKEKPAADGSELLARLSDPKFRELVQILSTASDKDLDLLIELVRRIDIGKQDA